MDDFPIEGATACPTGQGTKFGYSVEARYNYARAKIVCGVLLDNRWQRLQMHEGVGGVPVRRDDALRQVNLFSFEAAQALRWHFIAAADAEEICGGVCLETRLVKHRVQYSYSATPVAYVEPMNRRGDVPKDMRPEAEPADTPQP